MNLQRTKLILTIVFAILMFFFIGYVVKAQAGDAPVVEQKMGVYQHNDALANTPFYDAKGNEVFLKDFVGNVVLLNFWATWCAPCVKEMPDMAKLQQEYGDRGLKVVALSQDFNGLKAVEKFYKRHKIESLPIYIDRNNTVLNVFGGSSLPVTLLINRKGNVLYQVEGYMDWTSDEVKSKIESLL